MDYFRNLKPYFIFEGKRISYRILRSFQFWINKVDVDIYGSCPILLLFILLSFHPDSKMNQISAIHPNWLIIAYHIFTSVIFWVLSKWGRSQLNFFQVFGVLGYAFYAHFFLILLYLIFNSSEISATNYFTVVTVFVIIFLGSSTIKLFRIFFSRIRNNSKKFVVCSFACCSNVLFFLYLFLVYVDSDFSHPDIAQKSG